MPLDAQAQRLQALGDQEGVERGGRRAEITQQLDAGFQRERGGAQIGEHHTVIARVGGGETRELPGGPVEGAAVDDHPGDRGAVAAEVFGGRVHHDIRTLGERLDQVRRRDGVIHDQRNPVVVGHRGDPGGVEDVDLRIGDGLCEERLGVRPHRRAPRVEVVGVGDERRLDPQLGQRVMQQVVGAAVEPGAGHDVVPGAGEVQDCEGLRGLARGQEQRRHPALECGDALLDDVGRRIHQPGVDVAGLGQPEQRGGVVGAVEGVGGGLVDRQRPGVGVSVGSLAGVDLLGLEGPVVGGGHGIVSPWVSLAGGACAARPVTVVTRACCDHWVSDSDTYEGSASGFPVYSGGPSWRTRACRAAAFGCSTWSSPGAPHRGWRVAGQQAGA